MFRPGRENGGRPDELGDFRAPNTRNMFEAGDNSQGKLCVCPLSHEIPSQLTMVMLSSSSPLYFTFTQREKRDQNDCFRKRR
jgi:hypothetical protein